MAISLSDEELEHLQGLPHVLLSLYILGIRRYMDYKTGIVGIKRKISYQSLAEEIYIEPIAGVKTGAKSRQQIRRAVKSLERAGLITIKSSGKNLILNCVLAKTDGSVQNKADTRPTQEADTKADTDISKKTPEKTTTKPDFKEEGRHIGRHIEIAQADTPPVSGIYNTGGGDNARDLMSDFKNLIYQGKYELRYPQTWDGKTISMISAWIRQGVTLAEAEIAMDNAKAKATTPIRHPAYYLQAVLRYQHDSQEIRKKSEEVKNHVRTGQQGKKQSAAVHEQAERALRSLTKWRNTQEAVAEPEEPDDPTP